MKVWGALRRALEGLRVYGGFPQVPYDDLGAAVLSGARAEPGLRVYLRVKAVGRLVGFRVF